MKYKVWCTEQQHYWTTAIGSISDGNDAFIYDNKKDIPKLYECDELHTIMEEVPVYTPQTRRLQPGWPSQNKQTK
jgi:hypothetical protein